MWAGSLSPGKGSGQLRLVIVCHTANLSHCFPSLVQLITFEQERMTNREQPLNHTGFVWGSAQEQ